MELNQSVIVIKTGDVGTIIRILWAIEREDQFCVKIDDKDEWFMEDELEPAEPEKRSPK